MEFNFSTLIKLLKEKRIKNLRKKKGEKKIIAEEKERT